MNVTRLQLANLRAFEQAEFEFNPRMTLLVGINGVGKTTVLDALRTCLSKILPEVTASRSRALPFTMDDLRVDSASMTVQLSLTLAGEDFSFVVHKQRETTIAHKEGEVREQIVDTPDKQTCTPPLSVIGEARKSADKQPLGVFFATRRSLVSDAAPTPGSAGGGQAAAFAEALAPRELRLSEMAQWMRAQEELASEYPSAKRHLAALHRAAKQFLPECKRLRAETSPKPRLLIQKDGISLDVRQLSEGERGLLALVLDLARRLSQANPGLADPVKMGQAIVLIDELDLHLHPKWQRTIVESLTRTFPRCQFIATTHSPQIVAAVEPEQVLLLTDAGIVRPDRSLGMDSNWILRNLMQVEDRPEAAAKLIREVEALIKKGSFTKARKIMANAKKIGLDLSEWSVLEARMARLEVLSK
jgi:predicted ATP-binding protein involved in virulence